MYMKYYLQAVNSQVQMSTTPTVQASQIPAVAGMQQIVLLNPSQLTALQPQFMIQAPTAGVVSRKTKSEFYVLAWTVVPCEKKSKQLLE